MSSTRPESVDFVERAPLRATAARVVEAPPEAVFDALADAPGWPSWFAEIDGCRWLTPAPHGVGSQREVRLGPVRVTERFIVWDRPHRWGFTFAAARPSIARAGVELVDLEPLGRTTRVTYHMAVQPPRPATPLTPVLRRRLERVLTAALAGLDDHLRDGASR
jgi:uncharacterized protein YndB with AHSA1/START domain